MEFVFFAISSVLCCGLPLLLLLLLVEDRDVAAIRTVLDTDIHSALVGSGLSSNLRTRMSIYGSLILPEYAGPDNL